MPIGVSATSKPKGNHQFNFVAPDYFIIEFYTCMVFVVVSTVSLRPDCLDYITQGKFLFFSLQAQPHLLQKARF